MSIPLSLLDFPGQFFSANGDPLVGGKLQFYDAGTTTPSDTFADVLGDSANTNPVILDLNGMATIFLAAHLYDVVVSDSDDVQLYTRAGVGNPGQIAAASAGTTQTQGRTITSSTSVLVTDNTLTIPLAQLTTLTVTLPLATVRTATNNGNGLPLFIRNLGASTVTISPSGSDTVNGAASITLAATKLAQLYSDGVSDWIVSIDATA